MTAMSIPRFTADAALDTRNGHYRCAGTHAHGHPGVVASQTSAGARFKNPFSGSCGCGYGYCCCVLCYYDSCYWWCWTTSRVGW
jgi:hypothetical protein